MFGKSTMIENLSQTNTIETAQTKTLIDFKNRRRRESNGRFVLSIKP